MENADFDDLAKELRWLGAPTRRSSEGLLWQAKTRSGRRRLEVAGEGSKFGGGVDPAASTRLMSDWPMTST